MLFQKSLSSLHLALPLLLLTHCVVKSKDSQLASTTAASLQGTWVKRSISTSDSSALGIKSKSKINRYSLLQLTAAGDLIKVKDKTCDFTIENSGSSTLTFPPLFIKNIPETDYSYKFVPSATGGTLEIKDRLEIFGAQLTNPMTDALPTSASDSKLVDLDHDGNPGFTVDVSAKAFITIHGSVYIVQRQISSEKLTLASADSAQGPLVWAQEQKTLGASNRLLTAVSPLVTPSLAESSVLLRRLPAASDCATIKAQMNSLFPDQKIKK